MPAKSELRMHQYIIIKDISKNKTESGTFYHSSLSHLTLNKTMGEPPPPDSGGFALPAKHKRAVVVVVVAFFREEGLVFFCVCYKSFKKTRAV